MNWLTILYIIFWASVFLIFYNYFLYPLLLKLLLKVQRKQNLEVDESFLPTVTLVISAFNEEKVIEQKIKNSLELDYPSDKLTVVIISDASTDKTDAIVEEWAKRNKQIKLVKMKERRGKTMGLNKTVGELDSEIVVFSDANAIYDKKAIKELVKFFKNPQIGYVVGKAAYFEDQGNAAGSSEGLYWKYELWLKQLESQFYSVVGGDGAIYAIRKELFGPLEEDDINDFVNPLQIVAKGFRGIFNPQAVCYEYAANKFDKEYRRKRRIVNRSWRAFRKYYHLFSWKKHGKFLFLLFSHKVIRWFSWVLLLGIFISTVLINLLTHSSFFRVILILEVLFIALAFVGYLLDKMGKNIPRIFYLPYYYYLINYAAFGAFVDDLRGEKYVKWDHVRV